MSETRKQPLQPRPAGSLLSASIVSVVAEP